MLSGSVGGLCSAKDSQVYPLGTLGPALSPAGKLCFLVWCECIPSVMDHSLLVSMTTAVDRVSWREYTVGDVVAC